MRLKKSGCIILAAMVSLSLAFPVTSYAANFSDTTGHWAEFYINKVHNEHIIEGYPNGKFMPDKAVTRAEFASMINKTFHLDRIDRKVVANFSDVPYTSWYYSVIMTAINTGYAGGYSDNTFRPNSFITRQEAAVMLSRLLSDPKTKGNLRPFTDAKKIESWATDAMTKLIGKGYMGAYSDNKLHPTDPLTRAQTAKILGEILDNEDIVTHITSVDKDKMTVSAKTLIGDVVIDEALGDGSATIDNCIILGDLIVEDSGNGTLTLNNTRVADVTIDNEDGQMKIVAKGNTVVSRTEISGSCYLQASSKNGYGFSDITLKSSSEATLKGTFPKVDVNGSRSTLTLESGEITSLTVTGRYSDIILAGKAKITEANVNVESYFHGTGSIASMLVNAEDVTYETKPEKMTVSLDADRPKPEGDEDVTVTFKPKSKSEDVDVDTKITITFNTSMLMADGGGISDSDIASFITFTMGSKTGTEVPFTASINSAKKVITITPSAELTEGTKYYIVLAEEALENAGGNLNEGESAYFITEGIAPEPAPTTTTTPTTTTP